MAAGSADTYSNLPLIQGDDAGQIRHIGCTAGGDLYTFAHRTLRSQFDGVLNDNNKNFTVPAGRIWLIHYVRVQYVSQGNAGSRRLLFRLDTDLSTFSYEVAAGVTQPVDVTRFYAFASGLPQGTSFIANRLMCPIPARSLLVAGDRIQLNDDNNVAPTTDDMTITFVYDEYTV